MHKQTNGLSVITPAYNEDKNLPNLYALLKKSLQNTGMSWEWIIVDDHSSDETYKVADSIAKSDPRIRVFRFSRNFGSHIAIRCGLKHAKGACAVALAADLQDPPEFISNLLESWRQGAQIVWAVRQSRQGETLLTKICSRLYYYTMRKVVRLKEMPVSGADFFLIDRKVIDVFLKFEEGNTSIFSLLAWLGFKQTHLFYDKLARADGRSGWTFSKKIKLAIDSVVSHSYTPIRAFSALGLIIACCGFIYAGYILFNNIFGVSVVQGWASLMIVVLIIGGLQMVMLGILGEYLWRTLEQSRKRPTYLIEEQTDMESCPALEVQID